MNHHNHVDKVVLLRKAINDYAYGIDNECNSEEDNDVISRLKITVPPVVRSSAFERALAQKAEQVCLTEGMRYSKLKPIQRLFLTHYRCHNCKLLPLYYLDLTYAKRVRCSVCRHLISFTNNGKYGRLRKKIAFALFKDRETIGIVP